jgi:mRNA-degrading endonuclease RelE of RelBE toxin-antitoxin system
MAMRRDSSGMTVSASCRTASRPGIIDEKLFSKIDNNYKQKLGSWRFFYEIDEPNKIIFMIAAHHRSQTY